MNTTKQIAHISRRTDNTTWIIQAALKQPNCIIVSKHMDETKRIKQLYQLIIEKSPWYMKLYWKVTKRQKPIFISINDPAIKIKQTIYNSKRPVIFDNSCLI